jgi:phosphoglycerate kinase
LCLRLKNESYFIIKSIDSTMITLRSITDTHLRHKRVLIREDFNVPIVQDQIINDRRIRAALPTIEYALDQDAAVILLSHLGRPTLNDAIDSFSLAPIATYLSNYLNQPVRLVKDWITGVKVHPGEVVLCENVRLQPGEQTNNSELAQKIAQLGDLVVMDAFAVIHRTAASTVGMIQYARETCAGLLLLAELENLASLTNPARPFTAVLGGAKVSSKLSELEALVKQVDHLLLGGRLANTFLAVQSQRIDASAYAANCVEAVKRLFALADTYQCTIHLPRDVRVYSVDPNHTTIATTKAVSDIQPHDEIRDIGPCTINDYTSILEVSGTIFWNGPMGLFEQTSFQEGTRAMVQAIHHSPAFSIAGGGETLMAIDQWQCYPTCLSTGGGALLAWLTGKPLPAIEALQAREKGRLD